MKRKTFGPVTSQQVAQLAGVSQSAVSRTFTPGASISPATREKVLKVARELGYRPNAIARSLNTARSRIIGVVMSYFDNQFYPQVLEALAQKLDELNYHLLLFVGDRDGNVDRIFDQIMQYRVDGIVLASVSLSIELSEECAAAGIPVVLFNRSEENGIVSSVNTDNEAAACQIAEFLMAGEHQRFAYVAGLANSSVNVARQSGFISTLMKKGIQDIRVVQGDYDAQKTTLSACELFSSAQPPDAIFAANDHMALMVMDVARYKFGLRIPEDVSIIGYDDTGPSGWPSYALTSASQPVDAMVSATVALLMKQIESGNVESKQIVVPGSLVVRHSARRPHFGVVEIDGLSLFQPQEVQ
ncbi:LacI family DNA-binding transcriptional regulator [Serratia proteamaculans]|jgi:LacI family transcriptional regulator|uniref:LacI family DNA-binding transcriptional regulator n=1 Tax=Serratia proteamaculans TaxID=28151 RepID=A0A7U0N7P5_SERPR|nr:MULTISPECIES: LacI family DNA-binding transcriptional regulator [Serratia]HCV63794.1 LacI family DNA-binding transcriptional regulator [Serratia sp. (in: enterobacteria)]MBO1501006.1 LacI family DNA-binding transcriptional regulator [Serratia proteamaculans]MDW5509935.1 LacI family DNA-binding transcriptional regulator [Serratia proteamaculans]QQX54036.1 LacI family DNA-binding transcriptional regulator [Serratia proteamaculans]WEO91047.1 LacI family DNA-binding transcriptional regulator [S